MSKTIVKRLRFSIERVKKFKNVEKIMRSAKSAKKNRFTTRHSGETFRSSDEDTIRKIQESRKRARKLIRRAGGTKAKSNRQMRKEWEALLRKEDEKRHAEAKACASSIIGHIVR